MCRAILVLKQRRVTTTAVLHETKTRTKWKRKKTQFLSIMLYRDFYTMKIEAENSRPRHLSGFEGIPV